MPRQNGAALSAVLPFPETPAQVTTRFGRPQKRKTTNQHWLALLSTKLAGLKLCARNRFVTMGARSHKPLLGIGAYYIMKALCV